MHRFDRLAVLLAVTAVLLRCLAAPGLMLDPASAVRGELKLVICTSTGAKSLPATSDQEPVPSRQGDTGLCPYSVPGNVAVTSDPLSVGGERLQSAFEAGARDAPLPSAHRRGFAARAPPKFTSLPLSS